ncbi:calcium-translocating P-type ATPase, PMCA-type [Neobittarella massiliensis]|uniref:P-type Ca(2+) transporter n=1 Tax=Neobittarella massiliensis (ex Bilen et al. 2018) TaxID=2041842 RepID=A0A8J6IQW4_9FIRM|nr:calcium-translocating P-type ATPase, PMCA-type [Neobittarella massiliensis]MBC3517342.1 calcium-translocating P-type ATPase, PMCA-type [Neobittarella massiliensis]
MTAHTATTADLLARLQVDPSTGLTSAAVEENRRRHGANSFTREKPPTLARRIFASATEPMIVMLILAACITLGVNLVRYFTGGQADFLECIGIFAAISLSTVITVVMEGRSAKAFEALGRIGADTRVRVLRGGEVLLCPQKDIVVGDILLVETGDKLPADGRLLESVALMADESPLTGESAPVKKSAQTVITDENTPVAERGNMLYSGCFITGGSGKLVVTGVGDATEFGQIARQLASVDKSSTPLQEKMAALGKRITVMGSVAAAVVFIIQLLIFLSQGTATLDTVSEAFITSIVLIVAAVPEGLPTIVAVSLAINVIKMSRQNALVKKMIACETVGCISVICSDKTGTLTENRMTVTDVYAHRRLVKPQDLHDADLLENFCVNSTADIRVEDGRAQFIGNPTECALLVAAQKAGCRYCDLRNSGSPVYVYPFTSERKNMTTVLAAGERYLAYSKGSPEKILSMCAIDDSERQEAQAQIARFQEKACRVLGFAHKELQSRPDFDAERGEIEQGMIFDGFVAITDPLRRDVYAAVERCRSAGIELKMLTGDNIVTARAIADELGLLDGDHVAVEAHQIENMTDAQLARELPRIRVIARSTPVVKMRVVDALKAQGDVVAVTGDGINDAPAIKNADVGVAMGISGTEVSKEASDIVLLDDSFSTIVKAVQWGRGIYENFQRFIQFQLTVNLSSVIVVLCSILSGFAAPFTALQLLWINIIMDGPPALTLGLEPMRGDLMRRRPTSRSASIVSGGMLARIAVNGVFISAVFMAQHWTGFLGGTPRQQPTILFTLFVVFQLLNAFNSRELGSDSIFKNLGANRLMLGVFAGTFLLQVIITQFGGSFFGTVPLPLYMWVKIVALAGSVLLLAELTRLTKLMGRAFARARRT